MQLPKVDVRSPVTFSRRGGMLSHSRLLPGFRVLQAGESKSKSLAGRMHQGPVLGKHASFAHERKAVALI